MYGTSSGRISFAYHKRVIPLSFRALLCPFVGELVEFDAGMRIEIEVRLVLDAEGDQRRVSSACLKTSAKLPHEKYGDRKDGLQVMLSMCVAAALPQR